jgi:hypothetical protein
MLTRVGDKLEDEEEEEQEEEADVDAGSSTCGGEALV